MRIPDHLTCLLRNLYAGQEATVRTGHGTTGWFQIRKGVHQGCILSPCLFNLYAEYIMWNAMLVEAQAKIKIARRNINNLGYADDTTLMLPRVYTCSPSWTSLPIPSLWVIPVHQPQASCILYWTWTGALFLIWYYTCFNAILPNHHRPSQESKRLFYTSVSLLLSHIQGCRYHFSKFHIYALVYCIGVFLSGLLHSVWLQFHPPHIM